MYRATSVTSEPDSESGNVHSPFESFHDANSILASYSTPGTASATVERPISLNNKDKPLLPPIMGGNNMNTSNASNSKAGIASILQVSPSRQHDESSAPHFNKQGGNAYIFSSEVFDTEINELMRSELSLDILRSIEVWDFSTFHLTNTELILVTSYIMNQLGLFDFLSIKLEAWYLLVLNVEFQMSSHTNPYHNFKHVIDVFQSCYIFVQKYDVKLILKPLDLACIFLAALTHDLDHPGLNNSYQMNALTPLAIRYNDVSVLENHHCSRAFELLYHPDVGVLKGVDKDTNQYIRKAIIKAILSTDMVHHFTIKGEFESTLASKTFTIVSQLGSAIKRMGSRDRPSRGSSPSGPPSLISRPRGSSLTGENQLSEKERMLWISLVVHSADIGNPGKPWDVSRKWSDYVNTEFFAQGDLEKQQNLPVSPGCDRELVRQDEVALNFGDFIVAPFFIALSKALLPFKEVCNHLFSNRAKWHSALIARLENSPNADEVIAKWKVRQVQSLELFETIGIIDV